MIQKMIKLGVLATLLIRIEATTCFLNGSTCTFTGLRTTEETPLFYPTCEEENIVEIINFENTSMPILTHELCNTFRNCRELNIDNVNLKTIQPDAFKYCKQLSYLNISNNCINQVAQNIFAENQKLSVLDMKNNKLTDVQGESFENTPKLTYLDVGQNLLEAFRVDEFPVLPNLQSLLLSSNKLKDIDETHLLQNFPNLKVISVNNNSIPCKRYTIIFQNMKNKETKLQPFIENMTHYDCVDEKDQNVNEANNFIYICLLIPVGILVGIVTIALIYTGILVCKKTTASPHSPVNKTPLLEPQK